MFSKWINLLEKKSSNLSKTKIDVIHSNLRKFSLFQQMHPIFLRKLCKYVYVEFLNKDVFLFKQGDEALNWYGVICGSLDVQISKTGKIEDSVTLCTIGLKTALDDCVLTGKPHSVSAFTNENCILFRIKQDIFCKFWQKNVDLIKNEYNLLNEFQFNYKNTEIQHNKIQQKIENLDTFSLSDSFCLKNNLTELDLNNFNLNQNKWDKCLTNVEQNDLESNNYSNYFSLCQLNSLDLKYNKCIDCEKNMNLVNSFLNNKSIGNEDILNRNLFNLNFKSQNPKKMNQNHDLLHKKSNQSNNLVKTKIENQTNNKILLESKNNIKSINQKYLNHNFSFKQNLLNNKSIDKIFIENNINATVLRIAKVFHILILAKAPFLIRDRKIELNQSHLLIKNKREIHFYRLLVGSELVDWLLSMSAATNFRLHSRFQSKSMLQVLVQENALRQLNIHLNHQTSNLSSNINSFVKNGIFEDKYMYYKFCFDCEDFNFEEDNIDQLNLNEIHNKDIKSKKKLKNESLIQKAENEFLHCLYLLNKFAPSAIFRQIIQKAPEKRTPDELNLVYIQLMHIKAFSSLSNSIKQELAQVVQYELFEKSGTVVFNQGELGTCWYIILRGSVNVVILGKGTVCTLTDGDDFGKLAIVNESTRAATIITDEDDCQFLKVNKFHFDKIMCNAEANTVRLKEHGNEVLILQKMFTKITEDNSNIFKNNFKYIVMAGTPDKIVEYLLETRIILNKKLDTLLDNYFVDKNIKNLMLNGSLLYNFFDSSFNSSDTFLEDFFLTYQIYLSNFILCKFLLKYYKLNQLYKNSNLCSKNLINTGFKLNINNIDSIIKHKQKVIHFIYIWLQITKDQFFTDTDIINFLNEINFLLKTDSSKYKKMLDEEIKIFNNILNCKTFFDQEMKNRGIKKWKSDLPGCIRRLSFNGITCNLINTKPSNDILNKFKNNLINKNNQNIISILTNTILTSPFSQLNQSLDCNSNVSESDFFSLNNRINTIRAKDEMISRVYCADHTYTTLKLSVDSTAQTIKMLAAEKLNLISRQSNLKNENEKKTKLNPVFNNNDEFILVEIKSNGERILFKDSEVSIQTSLSLNGRLFLSLIDHLDALTPLSEQLGPDESSFQILEFNSLELAYYLTYYNWSLFQNVHENEYIYQVFDNNDPNQITSNLDIFLKHFNQIQYWVVTEICLQSNLSKRVNLVKKFIEIASICKDYQNLNTFCAIILGLSNTAVSRLRQTWEKLSNKLKRLFSQFEGLIDPNRNHRKYRMYLSKLSAPIIPFTPLLLKDMTFAHEGNFTFISKGMINFEKMRLVAQTLRVIKFCKSKPLCLENIKINVLNTSKTTLSNLNLLTPQGKCILIKIDSYIRDLKVIDNQCKLNQLSHKLEQSK